MENNDEVKSYYLEEIIISSIIFDESDSVTIFGYLPDLKNGDLIRWDFLIKFNMLTDLLLSANDEGDPLIKMISEKISTKLEIPTIIEVEDILGKLLKINKFIFEVYKTLEKDDNGDLKTSNDKCLLIASIQKREDFLKEESNKHISQIIGGEMTEDLLDEALRNLEKEDTYQDQLSEYLTILDNSFKQYLRLFEKDFSEKEARERTGLADEFLYRIAALNNKIINQ